jgi:hypothetical protein
MDGTTIGYQLLTHAAIFGDDDRFKVCQRANEDNRLRPLRAGG